MQYLALLPLAALAAANLEQRGAGWTDNCSDESQAVAAICAKYHSGNGATVTSTATSTIFVGPGATWGSSGSPKTVTVTAAAATTTVTTTVTATKGGWGSSPSSGPSGPSSGGCPPSGPGGKCLSDKDAEGIVNNFIDLLEFTSYNGTLGAPGRGYHFNVSAITLDPDFVDISDSINFLAGIPLGSVTFPNKTAFDIGQGLGQPEVTVKTLNIFHDCSSITWRYNLYPFPGALPVTGINYMIINDKGLIQKNYAEFDNGVWLQDLGQSCALVPPPPPVSPPATKRTIRKW